MLSEVELAFGENLLLLGGITGPRLSYALRARQGNSRALWELVAQLSLAQGRAVAEAHRLAETAMQVAGPSAFSFSTEISCRAFPVEQHSYKVTNLSVQNQSVVHVHC